VTLTRESADTTIASVLPYALKAGGKGVPVHIYGDNLPASVAPGDVDLGAGVTVTKVVSAGPHELVVNVDVADKTISGMRDLSVKGRP